jgi:hypothetical protein
MGKWTKKQWEIRNNGRIKMNEGNNGRMNEKTMEVRNNNYFKQ